MSLNVISVIIPSVPSEPTKSCVKLYPVTFFAIFEPVSKISPVPKQLLSLLHSLLLFRI